MLFVAGPNAAGESVLLDGEEFARRAEIYPPQRLERVARLRGLRLPGHGNSAVWVDWSEVFGPLLPRLCDDSGNARVVIARGSPWGPACGSCAVKDVCRCAQVGLRVLVVAAQPIPAGRELRMEALQGHVSYPTLVQALATEPRLGRATVVRGSTV